MKKSILVILLVLLAFSLWSVLVIAKDKVAQKPTQVQQTEPNVAPDAFPKVVQPKAQPVRPTQEDFKRDVLDRKGRTLDEMNNLKGQPVPAEDLEAAEKELMPTLCQVGNATTGGYSRSSNPYLYCYGDIVSASFTNPEDSVFGLAKCPQPIYPFLAKQIRMDLVTSDTATLLFQPEIREALYDANGCAYPGAVLLTGPVYTIPWGGGQYTGSLSLVDSVCLYQPWFSVMHFLNSDQFQDTTYCTPINTVALLSWVFDISGRTCQSYWGPYGEYGLPYGWFDVVTNGIESGVLRVRTRGNSRPENTCPIPPDPWYFKDSLASAPCGIPDFDQYQFGPGTAFCGPTAEANSYWWLNDKWDFDTIPGSPSIPALIAEIAAVAGTSPLYGTNCDSLEQAILQVIKAHGGWWFTETTVYKPDFWDLQRELKECHDVTLLLGFWQFDGANWYRFGGHFVTLAGVDIYNYKFAFSDPALDNAEAMFPNPLFGIVCHADPFPHVGNPLIHNNPANASHDFYDVAWPSASPGGYIYLPLYQANWPDFNNQNAGPFLNTGTYNGSYPVTVEVEQAIKVWPGSFEQSGEVDGSHIYAIENNHGGVDALVGLWGAIWKAGLYKGTLVIGSSQADLNCDYGDYYPTKTFKAKGPAVLNSFVMPASVGNVTVQQLNLNFSHSLISPDSVLISNYVFGFTVDPLAEQEPEQMIEEVVNIYNNTDHPITIEIAKWKDFDISSGGTGDVADFNQAYQSMWMYPAASHDTVFGEILVPHVPGDVAVTGYCFSQAARVYDGQYVDSLKYWMENLGWGVDNPTTPEDKSFLIVDEPITIQPGKVGIKIFNEWIYRFPIGAGGDGGWRIFTYRLLHFLGYYRGDVNKDGKYNTSDVIYMINYLFKGGPKPLDFVDQMDVNNDHLTNVADVIYSINYLFKGGPAPIDEYRSLYSSPYVDAIHKTLAKRVPGLFGDANWKNLHP